MKAHSVVLRWLAHAHARLNRRGDYKACVGCTARALSDAPPIEVSAPEHGAHAYVSHDMCGRGCVMMAQCHVVTVVLVVHAYTGLL